MTITKPGLFRSIILGLVLLTLIAAIAFLLVAPDRGSSALASPGMAPAISPGQWAAIQGANQLLLQPVFISAIYLPVVTR